jgi:hypothetical protein
MRIQDVTPLILTEYDAMGKEKKDALDLIVDISINSPFTENQITLFVSMMRVMSTEPARTSLLQMAKDAGVIP